MTHYTVLVRYEGDMAEVDEKVAEMLAPYDENLEVPRYKKRMSKDSVERALHHFNKKGLISPSGVQLPDGELTPEEIKEWEGVEGGKDKRGYYYMSTYNPRSKWDFYQIGGRWQGVFLLKDGAEGASGNRSLLDKSTEPLGIDVAYLKDIDWEAMRKREVDGNMEDYYKAVEYVLNELEAGKTYDSCVAMLHFRYGIDDETLEEHVAKHRAFTTHAVVDEHGWHEWSKMGWWAITYDEKESHETWRQKFAERFLSNPTEKTVVAVVDCHI